MAGRVSVEPAVRLAPQSVALPARLFHSVPNLVEFVLSEYLAPRVGHLHVVEVDTSLEAPLAEALEPFANTTLHLADAVKVHLGELAPPPTKVVGNLPYGVAATVVLKSIAELPAATLWVAMVQREVGERLAAAPGGKSYGATSVLAQLACEVRLLRRVPRTVFHPEPNVDSALVLMRRRAQRLIDSFNKRIFWLAFRVPSLGSLMAGIGLPSARMALRALWGAPPPTPAAGKA